ncbi:MAG: hypothetical protein ACX93P_01510 [Roseovarius sp.]
MATEDGSAQRPLAGSCVLDLTNVSVGPFACHQLAPGAAVIGDEAVGTGDFARILGHDPAALPLGP